MADEDDVRRWDEIQDRIADRYRAELEKIIAEAMTTAARTVRRGGAFDIPDNHMTRVERALRAIYTEAAVSMGEDVIQQFKSGFLGLRAKQEDKMFERIASVFFELYGARKVVRITETTRKQIRDAIQEASSEGLGVDQIAKRIREQSTILSPLRSAVIARSETHSSAMYSSQEVAKTSKTPLKKRWSAVMDDRTRDEDDGSFNHRVMDGVMAALEAPFVVPGIGAREERLMFPGDPDGSASNVINCRCSQTYRRAE